MKIGITGASGFIGAHLIHAARERGHSVVGFSRHAARPIPGCSETRHFDIDSVPDLAGCDGIVHLAGENVFGLWTENKRRKIIESRELGTRRIVDAIRAGDPPPRVLVSASGSGYYGDTGDGEAGEDAPAGAGFLPEVCKVWEAEARRAEEMGTRVVMLRTSLVLGRDGGALAKMAPAFRLGLGGRIGQGTQWMSWIHIHDHAAMMLFALENSGVSGPLNAAAPCPCQNWEFTETLARVVNRAAMLDVPAFAIRTIFRDFSRELLDSRRVVPHRALDLGFTFRFPSLRDALRDLLS